MDERRTIVSKLLTWRTVLVLVLWGGSLAAAAVAGAYAYRGRAQIRALLSSVQGGALLETNLYNLTVRKLSIPAEGRDGGIHPLADGILFANRFGSMWYIDSELALHPLQIRVPINYDEFEADPYNDRTVNRELFAVKDLLVRPGRETVRVFASYNYWYADRDCYVLRISELEGAADLIMEGTAELQDHWKTAYETAPCQPLTEAPNGNTRNPTLGAGGRMAALSDQQILVTIGGFGPETVATEDGTGAGGGIQDLDNPYGKVMLVDLPSGDARIYSLGHRNPQGLAVSSTGDIWETEHAARGGDELNRIVDGRNYGYPLVSYGTEYGSMTWSTNPRQGRHDGFEKPVYAWVPSVGTSQVTVIEGPKFEHWRGDVMVSSLNQRTLFRVRMDEGRVAFVEPIPIEHRIRDLAETADGTLVLKTDDNFLVYLEPLGGSSGDLAGLTPADRGRILATSCSGCHSMDQGGQDAIGPNLWGIVGRSIASRDDFVYSDGLSALDGRWSESTLSEFLGDPSSFAPGTSMATTRTYSDAEIDDMLAYLQTLR